ncbi:hypothetical protein [Mucilaginibacter sp.]|uniref:hypothetical protein n=1 Tax=Mucilaginibacter sp. TaxID=1882438 RepID=UPI0025DD2A1F|nr:hypothetical protein [Mucilaginibacter sp.]
MANVTLLHWNIETYGPAKYFNANSANFINYIATLINNVDAEIFAMVEVKNSTSLLVPPIIANAVNALQGILPAANPWRSVRANSGYNNEAYIIMYRTDRNFLPIDLGMAVGANVVPDHGLGYFNILTNGPLPFPSRMTANGGRRPFFAMFETNAMAAQRFSVISYHAMFGAFTPLGVQRIANLNSITEFDDGTPLDASMVSGDFNVDYNLNAFWYGNLLGLPTYQATASNTSLKDNPLGGNNPATFMANAYDNIFQTVAAVTPTGNVVNLMVESAVVPAPQPGPPAAQPGVGDLSAAAGAFNIAALNVYLARIANPIVALPPVDMDTAWDFVREGISNHYPVVVTVNI